MNFKNWFNFDEARWRGPVGGAFGNDSKKMQQKKEIPPITQHRNPAERLPPPQRMDNRFQGIDQRVQYGKSIEKQIFNNLVGHGLKLREPSGREDMYDKIDGWWETPNGEVPIQIKYRDTGDDILFEVMKDYRKGIPGRDMIGKAVYYAVLSKTGGKIVLVKTAEAKSLIEITKQQAEKEGFDNRGNYSANGIFLKIRQDPQSGQEKLMAYLPISIFRDKREFAANIQYDR